ncbi:MAG: GNAT family N-acetyltransferase [Candidatus Hodarchaeota archaeon]
MQIANRKYHIHVIEDLNQFSKLKEVWNTLVREQKYHIPFLCHEWFSLWLKHFLGHNKLLMLLVSDGIRPLAIVPFVIKAEKFKGLFPCSKLDLIGNAHSPVRKFIFGHLTDNTKIDIAEDIFLFLCNQFRHWDVIELDSLPEEDYSFHILSQAISKCRMKNRQYFCFGNWYLDNINYSGDEYIGRRSKNTKKQLKKRMSRLSELGNLVFKIGNEKEKVNHYMELYQQVRAKSWKHAEIDSGFHEDFRRLMAEKGWLRFGFLALNGSPIAVQIRIVCNRTAYFMNTAHDSKYDKFSPGTLLRTEFSKYLIDADNVLEIDTLKGDEPYKKEWTPKRRERKGITIFNNNLKGQFLAFMMITILQNIEKHPYLSSLKGNLSQFLKKNSKFYFLLRKHILNHGARCIN